jgi:predicted ABC-type ATPase
MRLLTTLAVILALVIGTGIWFNHSLKTSSDDLTRQIQLVSSTIRQQDWETAVKHSEKLEKLWEQKAKWWPVFLDHQEMDNIEFSLARVKEYVTSEDDALSLGQLSELKLMIEHIPRKEAVNLENIF